MKRTRTPGRCGDIAAGTLCLAFLFLPVSSASSEAVAQETYSLSEETEACLDCHEGLHPGLAGDAVQPVWPDGTEEGS